MKKQNAKTPLWLIDAKSPNSAAAIGREMIEKKNNRQSKGRAVGVCLP